MEIIKKSEIPVYLINYIDSYLQKHLDLLSGILADINEELEKRSHQNKEKRQPYNVGTCEIMSFWLFFWITTPQKTIKRNFIT